MTTPVASGTTTVRSVLQDQSKSAEEVKSTPKPSAAKPPKRVTPKTETTPESAVGQSSSKDLDPGEVIAAAALGSTKGNPAVPATSPTSVEEVTSMQVDLPTNVEVEETDRNPQNVLFVLKAFSAACMECSHLQVDPELPDSGPQKCHFSNGNEHCPARACRVEFVGEKVVFVSRFKKAKAANDSNRILRMMNELASKSATVRDDIMKELGLLG